jgi:endonuclease YncB( thermonuclease family)
MSCQREVRKSSMDIRAILAFVFLLASTASSAEILTGRVVAVSDGDTLTVLDGNNVQHKVRLSGIDAPEKGQPFGNVSRQMLAECAFNKKVVVLTGKKDRYGRSVGRVMVQDQDCNLRQVANGVAWHYTKYAREQNASEREAYAAAEQRARASRLGLWRDPSPEPPWQYRSR